MNDKIELDDFNLLIKSDNEFSEIDKQISELQTRKKTIILKRKKEIVSAVNKLIKRFDFQVSDFSFGSSNTHQEPSDKPKIIKYLHEGNAWSGRGRTPDWIKNLTPDELKAAELRATELQSNFTE